MRNRKMALGLGGLLAMGFGAGLTGTSCGGDDTEVPSGSPTTTTGSSTTSETSGTGGTQGTGGDTGSGGTAGTSNDDGGGGEKVRLYEDITTNTTWTADKVYVIPRLKQLFVKGGATLTIEPGTVIQGEQGAVLVITRGSKIMAVGTKEKPIVMTSAQPVGMKTPGLWGGLLVLGAAPINNNKLSMPTSDEAVFEAFSSAIPEGKFGGTDPHDDSGTIKYVRIEFGGYNFMTDREFNNLTLCGVGDKTVVDFVQVHHGSDDGIEFFGGTVNAKHIVSSQNEDDGFDTDNGWEGKAQFVIVQNLFPHGATEASNGYESDNHGTEASWRADPRTLPTVYNVTVLGLKDYDRTSYAAVLRRGTGGKYYNHIFMNFPLGIEVRDTATLEQLMANNLFIKNSIFFHNAVDNNNWPAPQAMNDIVEKDWFEKAEWNNRQVDPGLPGEAFSPASPNFKPAAGAAALTGGAMPPDDGFFDPTATFVGAVGPEDWTAGWTAYPQTPPQTP